MVVAPHPEPDTDTTLPYYHDKDLPVWANIPVKLSSMASPLPHHTTTLLAGKGVREHLTFSPQGFKSRISLPSRPQFISKQ